MTFTIDTYQNRYLAADSDRVDGILSVTAPGDGMGMAAAAAETVVGLIVDTSGSMAGARIEAAKQAVTSAINMLDANSTFFVVTFQGSAQVICPPAKATDGAKATAAGQIWRVNAHNGTAMSTGLQTARAMFARYPEAIKQAIFLTDGKNESEPTANVTIELQQCAGLFECDCWGVGTDWQVGEVQEIARALLGKASIIPDPQGIAAAFGAAVEKAKAKATRDVRLRIWTPVGTEVVFVKQVFPTIAEFTDSVEALSPQVRQYLTGSWGGGETRDFHVALRVRPGKVGEEMLAARPSVVYSVAGPSGWVEQEDKPPTARLFATWTADDTLSSRLDQHVAHYTGQDELAQVIQAGLERREQGDNAGATHLLGRAVQLADASGNADTTARLKKVVDVVDAPSGTVRLKSNVSKAASMDLQLESTTTRRARKGPGGAASDPGATT